MTELLLRRSLEPVARRERIWRRRKVLALYWVAAAVLGVVLTWVVQLQGWGGQWPAIIFAGAAISGAVILGRRITRVRPDYRQLAREIERQHPSLHALLLTAVEQQPDPATGRLNYLQEQTIQQAIEASQRQLWTQTISDRRLTWALAAQCACLLLFSGSLRWLAAQESRPLAKKSPAEWQAAVSPGDTLLEKGASLVVQARFPGRVPATATLVVTDGGTNTSRIPLAKTLDDPVFGGIIPAVEKELRYHVEYGERRTPVYKVTVFEYPRLERADVSVRFPVYTGWPEKRITDTRRVSAVEGSRLAVELHLNKPVRSAIFSASNQPPLALQVSTNAPRADIPDYLLQHSTIYDLRLVDAEGRANKLPARFVFEALPNRPPQLKILAPHGDQRVSPLEEIQFQGEATDDFGLRAYGLSYLLPGSLPQTITLGGEAKGNEKRALHYLLALEELRVRPDQLISYHLWAEDFGPDGQIRRTVSDLFFAEVRPFDEVYREGMSMDSQSESEQQQQGNPSETHKLLELQKQIVSATWKLQQTGNRQPPAAQYATNLAVIRQSQEEALSQTEIMRERARSETEAALQTAQTAMEDAVKSLRAAADSREHLSPALTAEQTAYQALLNLNEREYQVARSRSSSAQGSNRRNAQQLDQLDLREEENRYETARQAEAPRNQEQQENLAVLDRLKELARRQQDINRQIQELQNTLQAARTEAEKEEARRQLKRLREEQRDMLADLDETRQRMERTPNARNNEMREQFERTREQAQQTSQALEQENTGQALASGARTERELRELNESFRQQTSAQFAEEMREMRQQARQMREREQDIQRQFQTSTNTQRKSLSEDQGAEELARSLREQQNAFTNLQAQVRDVGERAEASQPLLARQLQEVFRQANPEEVGQALAQAERLVRNHLPAPAERLAETAGESIRTFTKGIEQAAESVLGNETEALRLAQRELDSLARQLEREATDQANEPGATDGQSNEPGAPNSPPNQAATEPNQGARGESANPQSGNRNTNNTQGQSANPGSTGNGANRDWLSAFEEPKEPGPGNPTENPLTGSNYGQWSERLGNVETMVDSPELRQDLARVRDRARGMRAEFKRHARPPNRASVQSELIAPLTEVRRRLAEILARQESPDTLAPIDRDPVPPKYADVVRQYYENLSRAELPNRTRVESRTSTAGGQQSSNERPQGGQSSSP